MAVDQESLLDGIIPKVFFSKITLEGSGVNLFEDNPHIEEVKRKKTLKETTDKGLIVNVQLLLKEKLTNDLIGTWFDKIELTKYLQLRLVQSTNEETTALLSLSRDSIDLVKPNANLLPEDVRVKVASRVYQTFNLNSIIERVRQDTVIKTLTVKKDVVEDNSALTQFTTTTDNNGNKLYNITYNVRFELSDAQPEHLAYFAITSFDIEALLQDYNLSVDSVSLERMNSKVASEIVFQNSELASKSYIFYDTEGNIWTGAVHKDVNDKWMSKSKPQPDSKELRRVVVPNTKLQDFRQNNQLERLNIDISKINKKLNPQVLFDRLAKGVLPQRPNNAFFSDMLLSRNKEGDCKFFFSVDLEKAMAENALFGSLIKDNRRLRKDILKGSTIRSLRVLRRRVRQFSSLDSGLVEENIQKFDKNMPDEVIVNSSEKTWKSFSAVNNKNASVKEVSLATLAGLEGVRSFTGMDKTMSDITDGVYQYIVEIEIDDASVKYIQEKINKLAIAKADMQNYFNLGNQPVFSTYLSKVDNPHIDSPKERARANQEQIGSYDIVSNRFTDSFIKKMTKKYSGRNRSKAPWVASVSVYADTLDLFTGRLATSKERISLTRSLFSFTHPKTANPGTILAVLRSMDYLLQSLSNLIGTQKISGFEERSSQPKEMQKTTLSNTRSFKVTKVFNQLFDSDLTKGVGVDYISRGKDETLNDDGLRVVKANDYSKRVELETLNFFKSTNADLSLSYNGKIITQNDQISNTDFTYLTPSRLDTRNKSLITIQGDITRDLDKSFPQNSPRVEFGATTTSDSNKVIKRVDDSEQTRGEELYSFSTDILKQVTQESPTVSSRITDSGNGAKSNTRASDISSTTFEESLNNILEMGSDSLSITPVTVKAVKEPETGFTILEPEPFQPEFVPPRNIECENPDLLKEKLVFSSPVNKEIYKEGKSISAFMDAVFRPNIASGRMTTKKANLNKANATVRGGISSRTAINTFVDLASVKNLNVIEPTESRRGETRIIQGLKSPITEKDFKLFPNHIKALFLQGSSSDSVKRERFASLKNIDILSRRTTQAEIDFSYGMINKVQFLSGFKEDIDGNIMIKDPIWKDLTRESHNSFVGETILCRMKKYENDAINLKRSKAFDIPVYDEYFLLTPKTKISKQQDKPDIKLKPGDLTSKITEEIKDLFPEVFLNEIPDRRRGNQDTDDDNISYVPIKIEIIETNADGSTLSNKYDIVDGSPTLAGDPVVSDGIVEINNNLLETTKQIVSDFIAMDVQTEESEPEYTSSNIVEDMNLKDKFESLAVQEGLNLSAEEMLADEEITTEIERNEVSAFKQAYDSGSGLTLSKTVETSRSSSEALVTTINTRNTTSRR